MLMIEPREGVPVPVIAAWIGHKDTGLTVRLYAHSQFVALQDAGASLDRVVTLSLGAALAERSFRSSNDLADVVQWQNISFPS
jgi:hypothetical protein